MKRLIRFAGIVGLLATTGCVASLYRFTDQEPGKAGVSFPIEEATIRYPTYEFGNTPGSMGVWNDYSRQVLPNRTDAKVTVVSTNQKITSGIEVVPQVFLVLAENGVTWFLTTLTIRDAGADEIVWRGRLEYWGAFGDPKAAAAWPPELKGKGAMIHLAGAIGDLLRTGRPGGRQPASAPSVELRARALQWEGLHAYTRAVKATPKVKAGPVAPERFAESQTWLDRAINCYEGALANLPEATNPTELRAAVRATGQLVEALMLQGDFRQPKHNTSGSYDQALVWYRRALKVCRRFRISLLERSQAIKHANRQAEVLLLTARMMIRLNPDNMTDESRGLYKEALELYKTLGPPDRHEIKQIELFLNPPK